MIVQWFGATVGAVSSNETLGQRIARIRHLRNMSQTKLAREMSSSRSMVAQVELGIASPSTGWIGACAAALSVDSAVLTGTLDTDPEQFHRLVPTIRRALASVDLFPDDIEPRPLADLRADVVKLGEWRRATKYEKIGVMLPDLVDELLVSATENGEASYALLTGAYRAANTLGHKLGYADLSLTAVERMEWASERSGDPLLIGMTHYLRAAALTRIGAGKQAIVLLNRAIAELQPIAPSNDLASAVYSALHMKAGVIAATLADRQASDAHLDEAEVFAGTDRVVYETVVGRTNVQLHRLAAAVDLGDVGKAEQISTATNLPDGYAKERSAYFWIDTARAYLGQGQTGKAIEALWEAQEVAPEHFQASSTVDATLDTVAAQERRAGSDSLRRLAVLAGKKS